MFKLVSAKSSNGIEELFFNIGNRLLNQTSLNEDKNDPAIRRNSIKISYISEKNEQKSKLWECIVFEIRFI